MCLLTDLKEPKPVDHRAKLAHTVPFKVAINNSPLDRLVQIALYMPESQLHLHSCISELMNPASLEKAEKLKSIQMDERCEGAWWARFTAVWKASLNLNLFGCQWIPYKMNLACTISLYLLFWTSDRGEELKWINSAD